MTSELTHLELDNIFIPSKVPSKKLMIVLHGRGDSSEGFTSLPSFFDIDEMNYLLLDAPFEYYTGYSWYPLPPDQLPGIKYSSEMLTKVLDTLFEEEFEAKESFLFGFSQGALLTFEFGARYDKALAGYIAISGYVYDAQRLLYEMDQAVNTGAWLCTHGLHDDVLPFQTTYEQIRLLQEGGFEITFESYPKEHTIDRDELAMIKQWIEAHL